MGYRYIYIYGVVQNTQQIIASLAPRRGRENSRNAIEAFSKRNTKCICEQQRGASTQAAPSPVSFCHWKSEEVFIALIN